MAADVHLLLRATNPSRGPLMPTADQAAVRTPLLIACAAAYGLALAWAGVQIAAREAETRLPELCQVAVRSTI